MRTAWLWVVLLTACGGPQQQITREPSKPAQPQWVTSLPKESGYVYVVGVRSRAKSLEEGKQGAHENATVQVSNVVGTQIRSQAESRMSTEGDDYSREDVAAQTQAFIESLLTVDEYWEKTTKMVGSYYEESFDVWVLAKFPLNAADKERKRQAAEQAEQGRDAFKRFMGAGEELNEGNERQAWILLTQARRLLGGIPGTTEIHQGEHDTAADLQRAVDRALRALDEKARGVRVVLEAKDPQAQEAAAPLTTQLSQAISGTKLILRTDGDARFVLTVSYEVNTPHKKVMGQRVGYLTFAGNLTDTWSGAALSADSGEVKGFGKTPAAALAEAALEAAKKLGPSAASAVAQVLEKDAAE